MGVKITGGKGLAKLVAKTKTAKMAIVKAGFFEDARYPDGTPVVDIAVQNEYGDDSKNIPARPFMDQTFSRHQKKWLQIVNKTFSKQLKDDAIDYNKLGNAVGLVMKGDIKDTIVTGDFVPNAPYTVAIKGKDTPLRDTLVMLNAVNYQVVKK